jgi:hypothetical protein
VRKSWLIQQADIRCNWFARLLARLDPKWPVAQQMGRLSAYYALLRYLDEHCFPVFYPEFEDWGDGPDFSPLDAAWEMGIPVDVCGREYDDRFGSHHAAYSAVEWFFANKSGYEGSHGQSLNNFPALKMLPIADLARQPLNASFDRLGRGWQWRAPWEGLRDLVNYCTAATGHSILDYSHMDINESGGYYPRWSLGEIRAITAEWRRAKPKWERIMRLADYIDEQPLSRVPLMLRVLTGDADARASLSERKPARPRARRPVARTRPNLTLVEVFGG